MSFVPVRGFCCVRSVADAGVQRINLGPLADGQIVRRCNLTIVSSTAVFWSFRAWVGPAISAQNEFNQGQALINDTDAVPYNGGEGSIGFMTATSPTMASQFFSFFPAVPVSGSNQWIAVELFAGVDPGVLMVACFEVVRAEKVIASASVAP
jgi:hypothetical protein